MGNPDLEHPTALACFNARQKYNVMTFDSTNSMNRAKTIFKTNLYRILKTLQNSILMIKEIMRPLIRLYVQKEAIFRV